MKTLLIVFAILLLLLTLLSTFGGSIRPSENFQQKEEEEEEVPLQTGEFFYDMNKVSPSENFQDPSTELPLEDKNPPPPTSLPSMDPSADGFAIEPFEMEEPMYASF